MYRVRQPYGGQAMGVSFQDRLGQDIFELIYSIFKRTVTARATRKLESTF